MKAWITRAGLAGACALGVALGIAYAADHKDYSAAIANPSLDITDVYAFKDGANLVFVMDVNPLSGPVAVEDFRFKIDTGLYTFHITSGGNPAVELKTYNVQFADKADLTEFIRVRGTGHGTGANDDIVGEVNTAADSNSPKTVASGDAAVKVFAGPRDDPFFFSLNGNGTTYKGVTTCTNAGGCLLGKCDRVGAAGCFQGGAAAPYPVGVVDTFAGKNVSAIVIEVPMADFPTTKLGVWASTSTF